MEGWTLDGGGGLAKINCFPSCKITDGLRGGPRLRREAVVQCFGPLHASSVQKRISLILREGGKCTEHLHRGHCLAADYCGCAGFLDRKNLDRRSQTAHSVGQVLSPLCRLHGNIIEMPHWYPHSPSEMDSLIRIHDVHLRSSFSGDSRIGIASS